MGQNAPKLCKTRRPPPRRLVGNTTRSASGWTFYKRFSYVCGHVSSRDLAFSSHVAEAQYKLTFLVRSYYVYVRVVQPSMYHYVSQGQRSTPPRSSLVLISHPVCLVTDFLGRGICVRPGTHLRISRKLLGKCTINSRICYIDL